MSGAPYFSSAGEFLIRTLLGLYIGAIMLRFLLQAVRADFYNPLVQALVKITNPPLIPLRRIIPGLMGLDMAALVLMLVLKMVELLLVAGLGAPTGHPLIQAVAELLNLAIIIMLWAVIIQVILSWVSPDPYNPIVAVLYQLTEPILRPARNIIPPISGIDLSPLVVLIVLQLTRILLIAPLYDLARAMA